MTDIAQSPPQTEPLSQASRVDWPIVMRNHVDRIERRLGHSIDVLAVDGESLTIRLRHEDLRRLW